MKENPPPAGSCRTCASLNFSAARTSRAGVDSSVSSIDSRSRRFIFMLLFASTLWTSGCFPGLAKYREKTGVGVRLSHPCPPPATPFPAPYEAGLNSRNGDRSAPGLLRAAAQGHRAAETGLGDRGGVRAAAGDRPRGRGLPAGGARTHRAAHPGGNARFRGRAAGGLPAGGGGAAGERGPLPLHPAPEGAPHAGPAAAAGRGDLGSRLL